MFDQICHSFSPLQLLPTLHNLFLPVSRARVHSMDSVLPGCANVPHSHPSPIASRLVVLLSLPDLCRDFDCCCEFLSSRWCSAADTPPLSSSAVVPEAFTDVPFRAHQFTVSYVLWLNHLWISVLISIYFKWNLWWELSGAVTCGYEDKNVPVGHFNYCIPLPV